MMRLIQTVLACVLAVAATAKKQPNILFVVVDDFGWGDVGWHRTAQTPEVVTPVMDKLVKEGVELNRHYVHMFCTPTRASFQSGRLPIHVLTNLMSPCVASGAIPRNMTGIAAKLKTAGYETHQVGKWDAGMATPTHTPHGRGYDTSLNYFSHGNWMYTEAEWLGSYVKKPDVPAPQLIDLWDTDKPANHLNGTGYEELIFRDRMLKIIRGHDKSKPLYLNYDSKIAHYPQEAPVEYQSKFASIKEDNRRMYHSMINFLDDQLGNITGEFKAAGLWENTIMVLSSDNGGYVKQALNPKYDVCNHSGSDGADSTDWGHGIACFNGEAGANNYPLRGGKYSQFEGGIRVNAFVSGGYLPAAVRGTKSEGMIHIADWYGTLNKLAGVVDPFTDKWAAASGLPPVDSVDVWPLVMGAVKAEDSPRDTILVNKNLLVHKQWKFCTGSMQGNALAGPRYPNASSYPKDFVDSFNLNCGEGGCLFDVVKDVLETTNVAAANPKVVAMMSAMMKNISTTIFPRNSKQDPECKKFAKSHWGGFLGPWLEVPKSNPTT